MRLHVCALMFACCCPSAFAATLHVDTFDATTQGWAGGSSPTRQPGGGPGGAGDPFLRISSVGNNLAVFNFQPAWIGNLSTIGAGQVNVDLMSPSTSASLSIRLVLFGPGSTDDRWTSAAAQIIPTDGVWRPYSFGLTDLVSVQGSGTFDELLGDTLRVMLRHDTGDPSADGTPVIGSLGIDNIQLASMGTPPIPGDFDGDGGVDGDDLTKPPLGWTGRFGVDLQGADFLVWQRNFGSPPSIAVAGTAVPEAPTELLAATAAILPLLIRRRVADY